MRPSLLIQVFLRGGCDALNFVIPTEGPDRGIYEQERATLKIAAAGPHAALPLERGFGLHPAAKPLHELFAAKHLGVVVATGLPRPTRSHFDAQAVVEAGAADPKRLAETGWLARYMASAPAGAAAVSAVGLGAVAPASFRGWAGTAAIPDIDNFNLGGPRDRQPAQRAALRKMYAGADGFGAVSALDAMDELEAAKARLASAPGAAGVPASGEYPNGEIGKRFRTVEQLLRMGLPVRAVAIDMGGWDTHKAQGAAEGAHANLVAQLAQSLAVFWNELARIPAAPAARIAVMSEFGRRVKENGNGGTDHGHGGFFLALGGDVNGGRVYGQWPGLATEKLFERADIAVTTDGRGPLLELAGVAHGTPAAKALFPGYAGTALGLVRAKA